MEKECMLVKDVYHDVDVEFWREQQATPIPPVGLPDIKWKELHSKWGPFVPQEKRQQWRYYHEAPPKEKLAEVSKHSKKARLQRSKRTRTIHDRVKEKPTMDNKEETTETAQPGHGII